jgi:hypothetical protein
LTDGECLATLTGIASHRGSLQELKWENGPQAFLRIIPTKPINVMSPLEIYRLISSSPILMPMGRNLIETSFERNKKGAVAYSSFRNSENEIYTKCFTQVFRTGELWGIEGNILVDHFYPKTIATSAVAKILYGFKFIIIAARRGS